MVHSAKKAKIRRLLAKGFTGWEAGKLLLQNLIDANCSKSSLLSEADIFSIENMSMQNQDVRDYNMLMGLGRRLEKALLICKIACDDACLDMSFLMISLRDA